MIIFPFLAANPPIYIAFLWHMHQPIYWPYESIVETENNNYYDYSVIDIHNQRWGPYTTWLKNAVQMGIDAGLEHLGTQVSFSGSLVENLNNLEANGNYNFQNWKDNWNYIKTQTTSLGNPRLDMVGFGYHHPLMGLIDEVDIRKQIQAHKQSFSQNFAGEYSKGFFPPENAFSQRMIPALVEEGLDWVLIDNIHFERVCDNYPYSTGGNLYEPNQSDVLEPDPNDWVQLTDLWAGTPVSVQWAHQPHYIRFVNPETGEENKMIGVPASRYLGNEDGRGGFGALQYEAVMSQFEPYNTDSNHPILIVLHHDGDNYGGGSESYYNNNFSNFVQWLQENPDRFVCTTIQDYLEMYPPDETDVVHVEPGSWSGADNGDPEFKKWNGDPYNGYSPDRNSWGVVTAAKNFILTAQQISPASAAVEEGWHYLLNAQTSCYWYWDGAQNGVWDSHPTRACNLAISQVEDLIEDGQDLTEPTIYLPQREPYNPGGYEWQIPQPNDFTVWTYVYDVSGLAEVKLKYRLDIDGVNSKQTDHNETYAGGTDVQAWQSSQMSASYINPQTDPLPMYKADEFSVEVSGFEEVLLDYYVEATDLNGNIAKSPIQQVWVGESNSGGGGNQDISWQPQLPTTNDLITITIQNSQQNAYLHWGVNGWQTPTSSLWPPETQLYQGSGPAVETPFEGPNDEENYTLDIGPFPNNVSEVNFAIHYFDDSWDNNNGNDFNIVISGGSTSFVMDGILDASSVNLYENGDLFLNAGFNGSDLYVATNSASLIGQDVFVFISETAEQMQTAPWNKAGQVASWDLFLANESLNGWSGWHDHEAVTGSIAGPVLEGIVNVSQQWENIPGALNLYVGMYQTEDGGILTEQIPAGNGNEDIEFEERISFELDNTQNSAELTPTPRLALRNYPNPFNPTTKIEFLLPKNTKEALISIYNLKGQLIRKIPVEQQQNFVWWNGENDAGKSVTSGIYLYQLTAAGISQTKKMVLIK